MSKLPKERYFLLPREGGGMVVLAQQISQKVPPNGELANVLEPSEVTENQELKVTTLLKADTENHEQTSGVEMGKDWKAGGSAQKWFMRQQYADVEGTSMETKLKLSIFEAMCRLIPRESLPTGYLTNVVENSALGLGGNDSEIAKDITGWLIRSLSFPKLSLVHKCHYKEVMEEIGEGTVTPGVVFKLDHESGGGGGHFGFLAPQPADLLSLMYRWQEAAKDWSAAVGLNTALANVSTEAFSLDYQGTRYKCVLVMEFSQHPGIYYVGSFPSNELSLEPVDKDWGYWHISDPSAARPAYLLLFHKHACLRLVRLARLTLLNSSFLFTGISVILLIHALFSLGLLNSFLTFKN